VTFSFMVLAKLGLSSYGSDDDLTFYMITLPTTQIVPHIVSDHVT